VSSRNDRNDFIWQTRTRPGTAYHGTALVPFDSNKYSAGYTTAPGAFCRSLPKFVGIFVNFAE